MELFYSYCVIWSSGASGRSAVPAAYPYWVSLSSARI